MKNRIAAVCCLISTGAIAAAPVARCDIGGQRRVAVEVYRDHEIAGSHVYWLRYGNRKMPFFGDADASRGLSVKILCVGRRNRALVVYGEFTSNYLQGFSLTFNSSDGNVERLNFAERYPPEWLYLSAKDTTIVMQTHGVGEIDKKFVAYHRRNGDTIETSAEGMDTLPETKGFDVISLRARAK